MPESNKKFKIDIAVIIIITILIIIDQASKILIIANGDKQQISKWNVSIVFNSEKNEYSAESYVTTLITDIVVFVIIIKFLKEQRDRMSNRVKLCLSLILAGRI